ncbi:hypothetical protein BGX38DRAFT_1267024 [Terfezia claveryi]|nr:hypothetical protein BGX38DRAFT_1267024 [Terfezia claveryi]
MSDSTFAEFGELVSQLLNAELRSNNSRNDSAVVETSMAVDSVNGWANESSWSLFTDMLDTGSSVYAAYACNTGPSAWTFDADFIPNWGTTERQNPISHDNAQFRRFLILESTVAIVRRLLQARVLSIENNLSPHISFSHQRQIAMWTIVPCNYSQIGMTVSSSPSDVTGISVSYYQGKELIISQFRVKFDQPPKL